MTTLQRRVVLGAIVLLALALRLHGIQYGLPAVYNPDEVAIMARALSFAKGTLNPHNFLYPTLYFYVLFGWVGAYLGFVWLTGGVASVAALQQLYFADPTGIYTAGRVLGALFGALCVPAIFVLGRRLFDVHAGLAAAVFVAVAPLAVRDSHYVKHDIPATLAVVMAYVAITRIWPRFPATEPTRGAAGTERERVKAASRGAGGPDVQRNDVLVAGAACGVAFSTHYYCIFLALPLAWAIVLRWREAGWRVVVRHLFTAAAASAVLFLALSPFLIVEPLNALRDITANRQIVIDRAAQSGAFAPAQRYLDILWTDSLGRTVVALGAAGAGWMLVTAPSRAILLLLFPAAFFAFIVNTVPASRYLNPVVPFVALFAAWALRRLALTFRAPVTTFWIVAVACAVPPLAHSVRTGQFFRMEDTRAQAERFVEEYIPPGATVLIQPYSVVLNPSREALVDALIRNLGTADAASTKYRIQLGLQPYPQPGYRVLWLGRGGLDADKIYVDPAEVWAGDGLRRLRELGVAYVILKRYNTLDPEITRLSAELAARGRLIAAFSPYRPGIPATERAGIDPFLHNTDTRIDDALERPGPPLEIWQLEWP